MKKNNDEWKIQIQMWLETSSLEYSRFRQACDRWLTIMASAHTLSQYILVVEIIIYFRFQKNNMKIEIVYSLLLSFARWTGENEWGVLCSISTTWLMINLFTLIVRAARSENRNHSRAGMCVWERFTGIA